MNRSRIWLGTAALLAMTQLACAAEPIAPVAPSAGGGSGSRRWGSVDGKTVVVETGSGNGGSFQPARSLRMSARPGKMEKGSYLGISASPVNGALRSQLNLQPGVGLVVESVEKESPAAEAGVLQYDVLQQFNDQILVDSRQL